MIRDMVGQLYIILFLLFYSVKDWYRILGTDCSSSSLGKAHSCGEGFSLKLIVVRIYP